MKTLSMPYRMIVLSLFPQLRKYGETCVINVLQEVQDYTSAMQLI